MTIDERLAALTMNLELTARAVEDERADRLRHMAAERERRDIEWAHERERLDVLTKSVEQLLTISHESIRRIEPLERRSA